MNNSDESEIKKEFQLERVIFFSDAVFAIIITIMILDVKLPEVERYSSELAAKSAFMHIMPKLVGYGVSFFAVGNLWMKHLRTFSFLKDYNLQLITINLLFLFSVSLFPFALSFFFNSAQLMQYKWGIYTYVSIYFFTVFTQTMLVGYLIKNKKELCMNTAGIETVLRWRIKKLDYFTVPVIAVLMAVTIYLKLNTQTSIYVVCGPMVVYALVKNVMKRKYYPDSKKDKVTLLSLFRNGKPEQHHTKKSGKQIA
jgi:uncharacterized membrane protein